MKRDRERLFKLLLWALVALAVGLFAQEYVHRYIELPVITLSMEGHRVWDGQKSR